jgi:hypothetical protein
VSHQTAHALDGAASGVHFLVLNDERFGRFSAYLKALAHLAMAGGCAPKENEGHGTPRRNEE